ncbi:S58 family peptidase [Pseudoroseomonas wenyumeiae]|uniref:S58 family peptidase n=1 Tax=Teichococcus wenyumeiae TaxID=2478470 RepID=A0A3A9JSI8_9PROT|nr:P1 family peptidase [Pseudoroseomonas wenyumeiae]RKK01929.1 S58 family peptidase [Pseudoroseomonas wenyumeiae]RMI25931.1 S58 family peptidase [Pseudoroseomonas wenyumeiae]
MKPRARELGLRPGQFAPGKLNAITDVAGVLVGQVTKLEGEGIRSGVTAILPHGGNLYAERVPAGLAVINGYGKLAGATQLQELGELETPIVLTNTLAVGRAVEALVDWTLERNPQALSVNAVVGETNDGRLNDIRARGIVDEDVLAALNSARDGAVEEGSVGAGTGTVAFGWKGGIGTSSRKLPAALGGFTVGALVQSNYGGALVMDGVPMGRALGKFYLKEHADKGDADGSVMVVIATDAPLSDRNLGRLALRSMAGLARTGAAFSDGSGDYAIAFSTHPQVRRPAPEGMVADWPNEKMSPLFVAVAEAVEEAVLNSLLRATTVESRDPATGKKRKVEAIDIEAVRAVLSAHRPE